MRPLADADPAVDREQHLSRHSDLATAQLFSAEECEKIIRLSSDFQTAPAKSSGAGGLKTLFQRVCLVTFIPENEDTRWIFDRIRTEAGRLNAEIWKFDLSTLEDLQLVSYGFLNHFARHMDSGTPQFCQRKLTVSIQLSRPSDYGGGSLFVWSRNKDRHAPRTQGCATFFPSHLWHRANVILWGQRVALVGWVRGERSLR
jgi:PKHD-type hydroxylase